MFCKNIALKRFCDYAEKCFEDVVPQIQHFYFVEIECYEKVLLELGSKNPSESNTKSEPVIVQIRTDNYAEETSWFLGDPLNAANPVLSGGPYQQNVDDNTLFVDTACVAANTSLSFIIQDNFGDGICCAYGSSSPTARQSHSRSSPPSGFASAWA